MKKQLTLLSILCLFSTLAYGNTWTVQNTNDNGIGSLRAAVDSANLVPGRDTITFDNSTDGDSIQLSGLQITFSESIVLLGNGMDVTKIDGQGNHRVFNSQNFITVEIRDLTIQNGGGVDFAAGIKTSADTLNLYSVRFYKNIALVSTFAFSEGGAIHGNNLKLYIEDCVFDQNQAISLTSSKADGGAVYCNTCTSVNILNSTFKNNVASSMSGQSVGGAIRILDSPTEIIGSSFYGNSAEGSTSASGGAISFQTGSSYVIKSSTISGNDVSGPSSAGGGINMSSGDIEIISSTITGNISSGFSSCCGGVALGPSTGNLLNTIIWGNYATSFASEISDPSNANYSVVKDIDLTGTGIGNLSGNSSSNPFLGPLRDNGGPTKTHALCPGSAAFNAGHPDSMHTDQRGLAVFGGRIDMGAYEAQVDLSSPDTLKRIYVDSSVVGGDQSGKSWASALASLSDAIGIAGEKDTIWVAKGTYFPSDSMGVSPVDPRQATFFIDKNILLYGGFDGSEVSLDERDWYANPTILSGDIGTPDDSSDNTYHVLFLDNLDTCTLIDGFTITRGLANGGDFLTNSGGGVYNDGNNNGPSNPTFRNCSFESNSAEFKGGAVHNYGGDAEANPNFYNCHFYKNHAKSGGGAIYNSSGDGTVSPWFYDCTFIQNEGDDGGAIQNNSSDGEANPTFIRCAFKGNFAGDNGGALYNTSSDGESSPVFRSTVFSGNRADTYGGAVFSQLVSNPEFYNCSFAGNFCELDGGAVYYSCLASPSHPRFYNCVVWGNSVPGIDHGGGLNPEFYSSLIQGELQDTANNLPDTIDPSFILLPNFNEAPAIHGNLRLRHCSPLIDRGSNALVPSGDTTDLDGTDRIKFGNVDIGAYEADFTDAGNVVIYVDSSNITGTENGQFWATAYTDLQDAIDAACEKDTIWVAEGTYYPSDSFGLSPVNPRGASFFIDKNIVILGGFQGGETSSNDRDWDLYPTILSGDIGTPNDNSDNTYHVVWMEYLDSCMVMDGFHLQEGNARGPFTVPNILGAAVYNNAENASSSPTFKYCSFSKNEAQSGGGAIYNNALSGIANPTFKHCTFEKNGVYTGFGGAVYNEVLVYGESSPTFVHCIFKANFSLSTGNGGAVYNTAGSTCESSPFFNNCVFSGNKAASGGAVYNNGHPGESNPTFDNCSFSGNNALLYGGAVYNYTDVSGQSNPTFNNTLIWGNSSGVEGTGDSPTFNASNVQGEGSPVDPLFVDEPDYNNAPTTEGNLRLRSCSQLINAGDTSLIPDGVVYDLDGNMRVQRDTVDIGAYETPWVKGGNVVLYVDSSNTSGTESGTSWSNAYTDLQDAIDVACEKDTIWVAQGTYFPTRDTSGTPNDRFNTFFIDKNIIILGGFLGDETSSEDRDWDLYPTVLSGDIGTPGDSADNTYHVVWMNNLDSCMLLEGFTITRGNANHVSNGTEKRGGGLYNDGSEGKNSSPTLRNILFNQNVSDFHGGAVNNDGNRGIASPSFINVSFYKNQSVNSSGGAICNWGQDGINNPSFTNCSFFGNNAELKGGAIHNIGTFNGQSNPTFTNCIFSGNNANEDGGAVSNSGRGFNNGSDLGQSNPTFNNCSFSGNNANNSGGAVFNNGDGEGGQSGPTFNNCSFTGNNANNAGGAMYNNGFDEGQSNPTFNNCSFSGNNANVIGGAVYNDGFDEGQSNSTFNNCSFSGNNANVIGGAVYNDGSNSGQSDPTFNNTVLWGNSNPAIANRDEGSGSANPTYNYSLIEGENPGGTNLAGNVNPQFVLMPDTLDAPTTIGNLRLKPCSPLINAGNDIYLGPTDTTDLDGAERIQNGTVDIGAYESPFNGTGNVVIYVDSSNTDTLNNGGSWATAFADLQDALCLGCGKDTIWVAEGTYYPTRDKADTINANPREHTFFIDSNLVILGGFEGDETSSDEREWEMNPTILSGDIGMIEDSTDNTYHVIWTQYVDTCFRLSGFTITEGNADGSTLQRLGGGMFNDGGGGGNRSNPSIDLCIFTDNFGRFGGAIYNRGNFSGEANPVYTNVRFEKNHARVGGALVNDGQFGGESNPLFVNCQIKGNASAVVAGGMFNDGYNGNSSPTYINTVISGNLTDAVGGGIFNNGTNFGFSDPTFINCTLSGNIAAGAGVGGAVFNEANSEGQSNPVFQNTIVYGNNTGIFNTGSASPVYSYSLIQGVPAAGNNLDGMTDPEFVDMPETASAPTIGGDLRLTNCSPVIDGGNNDHVPTGIITDIEDNSRIINGTVDLGAYEYTGSMPILTCNDVTLTFDGGTAVLSGLDSALIVVGSDPCFDTIAFSQKVFDCADLADAPIQITVSGTSTNGFFSQCNSNIHLIEDPDYCCSYGGNSDLNHIKLVGFESSEDTIENVTNSDNGYGDYKHLVTEVNAGAKLDVTLMSFTINPITYKYWYVWIDFNGNDDFSANELVYQEEGSQAMRNFRVTIPTGLISGNRALRIMMKLNPGFPDPCEVFSLGEVEDYTLYINACPDVLLLEDQSLGGVYFAGKEIRTKGEVLVTEDTKFMSQEFFLGEEFKVQDGVRFETVNSPCGGWLAPIPID